MLRIFPKKTIYVFEPDIELIYIALLHTDFSKSISENLLFFIFYKFNFFYFKNFSFDNYDIIFTPVSQFIKDINYNFFLKETFSAMGLFKKNPFKILVINHIIFSEDSVSALKSLGWIVKSLDNNDNLLNEITDFNPNLILSINLIPQLSILCKELNIKYAVWTVDTTIFPDRFDKFYISDNTYLFLFDKELVKRFLNVGYRNAFYLPLASNTERCQPLILTDDEKKTYSTDISFAGCSMINDCNEYSTFYKTKIEDDAINNTDLEVKSEANYLKKIMNESLRLHDNCIFEFNIAAIISKLEKKYKRYVIPLYLPDMEQLEFLLGKELSSRKRTAIIKSLKKYNISIYGDEDWKQISEISDKFKGKAEHYKILPKIYCASKINLNISRVFCNESLTMRVFDVLACKSFLLSDYKQDFVEYFNPEKDLVLYSSINELAEKIDYYLTHEEERLIIAENGFKNVIAAHSIKRRMLAILSTVFV